MACTAPTEAPTTSPNVRDDILRLRRELQTTKGVQTLLTSGNRGSSDAATNTETHGGSDKVKADIDRLRYELLTTKATQTDMEEVGRVCAPLESGRDDGFASPSRSQSPAPDRKEVSDEAIEREVKIPQREENGFVSAPTESVTEDGPESTQEEGPEDVSKMLLELCCGNTFDAEIVSAIRKAVEKALGLATTAQLIDILDLAMETWENDKTLKIGTILFVIDELLRHGSGRFARALRPHLVRWLNLMTARDDPSFPNYRLVRVLVTWRDKNWVSQSEAARLIQLADTATAGTDGESLCKRRRVRIAGLSKPGWNGWYHESSDSASQVAGSNTFWSSTGEFFLFWAPQFNRWRLGSATNLETVKNGNPLAVAEAPKGQDLLATTLGWHEWTPNLKKWTYMGEAGVVETERPQAPVQAQGDLGNGGPEAEAGSDVNSATSSRSQSPAPSKKKKKKARNKNNKGKR